MCQRPQQGRPFMGHTQRSDIKGIYSSLLIATKHPIHRGHHRVPQYECQHQKWSPRHPEPWPTETSCRNEQQQNACNRNKAESNIISRHRNISPDIFNHWIPIVDVIQAVSESPCPSSASHWTNVLYPVSERVHTSLEALCGYPPLGSGQSKPE